MSEYLDERILKSLQEPKLLEKKEQIRKLKLEQIEQLTPEVVLESIKKGLLRIDAIDVEFEKRIFLSDSISLFVPSRFKDMPENIVKIKYPMERRPNVILTDKTYSVNITVTQTDSTVIESTIGEFKDSMKNMLKKSFPQAVWYSDGVEQLKDIRLGYLELMTCAMDSNIYSLILLVPVKEKAVLINLNCVEDDFYWWEKIAHGIMETLELSMEKEG